MMTFRTLNYIVPPINAEIFVLNLSAATFTAREDLLTEPKIHEDCFINAAKTSLLYLFCAVFMTQEQRVG